MSSTVLPSEKRNPPPNLQRCNFSAKSCLRSPSVHSVSLCLLGSRNDMCFSMAPRARQAHGQRRPCTSRPRGSRDRCRCRRSHAHAEIPPRSWPASKPLGVGGGQRLAYQDRAPKGESPIPKPWPRFGGVFLRSQIGRRRPLGLVINRLGGIHYRLKASIHARRPNTSCALFFTMCRCEPLLYLRKAL